MTDGFFAHFGLPKQIQSHLGKNFELKLFHELCQLVGTTKSHTTPFHAQSDGQSERPIRSLVQMLKAVAEDHPETGPQRLPTVMAAYRMAVHKTTGITPNMAMLWREVMLPANLIARPPEERSSHHGSICSGLEGCIQTGSCKGARSNQINCAYAETLLRRAVKTNLVS